MYFFHLKRYSVGVELLRGKNIFFFCENHYSLLVVLTYSSTVNQIFVCFSRGYFNQKAHKMCGPLPAAKLKSYLNPPPP